MALTRVVCGLIFHNEKILICRRKEGKSLAGFWEFPGGKIETDEADDEALLRELSEELEIQVEAQDHFITVQHSGDSLAIELVVINCLFKSSSFKLMDHDRYEWVMIDDLMSWELAPADIGIAEALIKK